MDTKRLVHVEVKDADRGEVTAVISTFNEIDSDGDVTLAGAFEDGATMPISAYGHASWAGALPVGVAKLRQTDQEGIADGQFFMDTPEGKSTFTVVKRLAEMGLGQWSYGYDPVKHSFGEMAGRRVRYLEKIAVHEVSPVLQGAGVNTRTLSAKGAPTPDIGAVDPAAPIVYKAAIRPHTTETYAAAWDAGAVVAAIPDDASVSDLRSVFAWVDSGGDPEAKSSYRFPHHTAVRGGANVRACLAGIAALNGARGGTAIPAADRKGVYNHLAGHLRDADREPPELRALGGTMKFHEQALVVMADLSTLIDRATEVVTLRSTKGKGLAPSSAELLDWIGDDLTRLRSLLSSPEDEAAREYLRAIGLKNRIGELK